jgi:hypothetical protein
MSPAKARPPSLRLQEPVFEQNHTTGGIANEEHDGTVRAKPPGLDFYAACGLKRNEVPILIQAI